MSQLTIHNDALVSIGVKVPGKPRSFVDPGKSAFSVQSGDYSIVLDVDPVVSGQFPASSDVYIVVSDVGSVDATFNVKNKNKFLDVVVARGTHEDHISPEKAKDFKDPGEYQITFQDGEQALGSIISVDFPSDVVNTTLSVS